MARSRMKGRRIFRSRNMILFPIRHFFCECIRRSCAFVHRRADDITVIFSDPIIDLVLQMARLNVIVPKKMRIPIS
jgi:hypothetical protein